MQLGSALALRFVDELLKNTPSPPLNLKFLPLDDIASRRFVFNLLFL